MSGQNNYRSLFLSDLHIGSHNCKAQRLYNFLKAHNAKRIYLVGDIIEGRHLRSWPKYHNEIIQLLSERALAGIELLYIPGNHDSIFRHHFGYYGNLRICKNYYHDCIDGSILYVTHGDETDLLPNHLWLWIITLFEKITGLGLWEGIRTTLGWYIDRHTQNFENKIRKLGYKKVLCGHIHFPKLSDEYYNCGDWTYHCTAIAEHYDGKFELLKG